MRPLARPEDVLELVPPGTDLVVAMAAGEPSVLLDAIEAAAADGALDDVVIHQMHPHARRPSMGGAYPERLRHVSYFLSGADRPLLGNGLSYVPANFSEVPEIILRRARRPLVLASVGSVLQPTWGTNGEYVAALVRDGVPCVLEVNAQQPAAYGRAVPANSIVATLAVDVPVPTVEPREPSPEDLRIAELVAERIPHGATLQVGVGAIPDMVLRSLRDHRGLCIHTELLTDGIAQLAQAGALVNDSADPARATFALGTSALYGWIDRNPQVAMLPVDEVNDPRIIAEQPRMQSICATTEVDLYGQCASATVGGRWFSGSGGQLDFMRGVHRTHDGQGFIVMRSRLKDGSSRIRGTLSPGSAVTTGIHFVDQVVTEYGVAELRDRSLGERARALIGVAAPEHREALAREAQERGLTA